MSKKDEKDPGKTDKSWISDKKHVDGDPKVRNHCHVTGKYRGSAYMNSNIDLKLTYKIPVVFHSLKRYDSHHIM